MPTVLNAAGCDLGGLALDGEDLHDVASGKSGRQAVYSQRAAEGEAIYTAVTDRWKYAYSAPDNREFLFDRVMDPRETRNKAGLPTTQNVLKSLREQTVAFFAASGETAAVDGNNWKVYPKLGVPEDPDTGFILQDSRGFALDLPGYTD
jgi:arylsulfatase A-like enzyme